jgi:hypothetical protein
MQYDAILIYKTLLLTTAPNKDWPGDDTAPAETQILEVS